MSWLSRLRGLFSWGKRDYGDDNDGWSNGGMWGAQAASGVNINQATALTATTVLACISMLTEDFAKCTPSLFRTAPDGERIPARDHELSTLLEQPNEWQSGFDFRSMMMLSFLLRGNAYAVKVRDGRGKVIKLLPVNADWVALWEAPDGELFYRVTANGLHMMAELRGQPFLIPSEDMFHVRDLSMNGLTGLSRIVAAKESIGLGIAFERQAAQWMANSATPSGVLTTDGKLTPEAAKRMAEDWRQKKGGLQNAGAIVVLEQGLKYQQTAMTAEAADFINSRKFQITDVTRIWRVPAHMIGDLERATSNTIEQLQASYINLTMTSHTSRWASAIRFSWGLIDEGIDVDFDLSILTKADFAAQLNNGRVAIAGGVMTQNEVRLTLGLKPLPGGDVLLSPLNMGQAGSHATGVAPPGAGRPQQGSAEEQSPAARKRAIGSRPSAVIKALPRAADRLLPTASSRAFDPDEPRDDAGKWTAGAAVTAKDADGARVITGVYKDPATAKAVHDALDAVGSEPETHEIQVPAGAKVGGPIHVVASGTDEEPGDVHSAHANAKEAEAAALAKSQANWAAEGEPWEFLVNHTDAEMAKVTAAWVAEHPDDLEAKGFDALNIKDTQAYAQQVLNYAPDAKAEYPGLDEANEYFADDERPDLQVFVAKTKLRKAPRAVRSRSTKKPSRDYDPDEPRDDHGRWAPGAGMKFQNDSQVAADILDRAKKADPYDIIGLRVEDVSPADALKPGDSLPPSRVWSDNEPTEDMLPGTSVVKVSEGEPSAGDVERAMQTAGVVSGGYSGYFGKTVYLVSGDQADAGEDEGEAVIRKAKVLAVYSRDDDMGAISSRISPD